MNPSHGLELCGGDEEYRHYLAIFVQSYGPALAELESAALSLRRLRELAHQLKSVASYMGLERVAALARNAQVALDVDPLESEPIRVALCAELARALAACTGFLARG